MMHIAVYGGLLDRCLVPMGASSDQHVLGIEAFKRIAEYEPTPLAISSEPLKVCRCIGNSSQTDCGSRHLNVAKMHGGSVRLRLAVLDQDGNTLSSVIEAGYTEVSSALDKGEGAMEIPNQCTTMFSLLNYRQSWFLKLLDHVRNLHSLHSLSTSLYNHAPKDLNSARIDVFVTGD